MKDSLIFMKGLSAETKQKVNFKYDYAEYSRRVFKTKGETGKGPFSPGEGRREST